MRKIPIANPYVRSLLEWLLALTLALFLFLVLRNYVFRIAHVTGNSMEPTLNHNDMVILSRLSFLPSGPQPGDIVAFPFKENPSEYYIKRVIGLPGDEIDIQNLRFVVNGIPLEDKFSHEIIISAGDVSFPYTVEDGRYFVLGDNRNGSKDSRFLSVGSIPREELVGKVVLRFWPIQDLGTVE
jgi:signal peptidase I